MSERIVIVYWQGEECFKVELHGARSDYLDECPYVRHDRQHCSTDHLCDAMRGKNILSTGTNDEGVYQYRIPDWCPFKKEAAKGGERSKR